MWLEAAAGLALLTSFLRPAYASSVSFSDEQLTYDGEGWQTAIGPQACSNISQTVHTTSNSGDFFTFNFTGNAVYVRGPLTTLSNPATVILDGDIQTVLAPGNGPDGCGILYANTDVPNNVQEHSLTMVFSAASGSVKFSVSGITVFTSDTPAGSTTMPTLQVSTMSSPGPLGGTPAPTPTPSSNASATATNTANSSNSTVANPASSPSSSPPASPASTSAVSTSAFTTTPGMTTAIIGAIVGTIVAMLGLLYLFILLRRRITRKTVRSRDQENSFTRDIRDVDETKAISLEEARLVPKWGGGEKSAVMPQFIMETSVPSSQGAIRNIPTSSPTVPIPAPVASAPITRSRLSITTGAMQNGPPSAHGSPSMIYGIRSDTAPMARNQGSYYQEVPVSPERSPLTMQARRPIPSSLTIPTPVSSYYFHSYSPEHITTPPALPIAPTSAVSHPPIFSSPVATLGNVQTSEKGRLYGADREESLHSVASKKSSDPPGPGYF